MSQPDSFPTLRHGEVSDLTQIWESILGAAETAGLYVVHPAKDPAVERSAEVGYCRAN